MGTGDRAGHARIAGDLRRMIEDGTLPPGALLPSLQQLIDRYGVARMTAHDALDVLIGEGLVEARHGIGYQVREYRRIESHRMRRLGAGTWPAGIPVWSDDVPGRDLRVEDVQVSRVAPPGRVAAALGLPDDALAVCRSRVFRVDGRIIQLASSWLPADITAGTAVEEPDTGPGGTFARLAESGHAPVGFTEQVVARMPSRVESDTLGLPPGTPVLVVSRAAVDAGGRVVELAEMVIDASVVALTYEWAVEPG